MRLTYSFIITHLFFIIQSLSALGQKSDIFKDPTYKSQVVFQKYKNEKKLFLPDTSISYSIKLNTEDYSEAYIYGKFKGADKDNFYFETNSIYNNCYFPNLEYIPIDSNKYITPISKNYLIELSGRPRNKVINSTSAFIAWTSAFTVLFSPLVTIDYQKGRFLEKRYFGINRIALPMFATSLTLYFASDSKKIKISNKPGYKLRGLYKER